MADIPDYKLKIFVDALIALEAEASLNAATVEDDLAPVAEDVTGLYDENGDDIAADLREIQRGMRKTRCAASRKKYARSERGKKANAAARKKWNAADAGKAAKKAWKKSDAGKASKKAWCKTETGQACQLRELAQRARTLDKYLNRRIVSLDSEGVPRFTQSTVKAARRWKHT